MKRNFYKVAAALVALLVIPATMILTKELQKGDLSAAIAERKTTIDQFEQVKMGGKTYTALTQTSFLVSSSTGSVLSFAEAQAPSADWKTVGGFATKEQTFLTSSRMASKADLPIEGTTLSDKIPNHDNNWWLSDELTGEGSPRSFVSPTNQIDSGYDREIATNTTSDACGTKTEHKDGGLNTVSYEGAGTTGIAVTSFTWGGGKNYYNSFRLTNAQPLSDGRPPGTISMSSQSSNGSGVLETSKAELKDPAILEYMLWENNKNCSSMSSITSSNGNWAGFRSYCDGRWTASVRGNHYTEGSNANGPGSGRIIGPKQSSYGASCAGISVPASKASIRPIIDTSLSNVHAILTNPNAGVSDTLAPYPDAGIGPYTLQLEDSQLKMQLDTSVEGVSGNSITVDATENGKISIPYDVSGSTYDSVDGTIYISAMNNGNYAKLGTATQNGKGNVVLDVNNLVTKTNGRIDSQTITFDLYQEEITSEGYSNYISKPVTITMNIKALKEIQAPLAITNEDTIPYDVENPAFQITTTGGSGTGAMTYAIKTDNDHIASISGDIITYSKAGTITITAIKGEDDTYNQSVTEKTITIQKAKQNIEITNGDFKLGSANDFKISVEGRASTLTQPLEYAITIGEGVVATINGDTITPIKVGTIEVSVTSKGDAIYEDCTVKKTIHIANKDPQTPLQITNLDKFIYDLDSPTFEITTSGGSGSGEISYAIKEDPDGVASISGNTITYRKAGTFTITASKASDSTYQESVAEKIITIDKLKQVITITNTDFKLGSASDFKITIDGRVSTLTQPLSYDLTLGKGEVASINGDTITPIKAGTIEISVTSLGDDIYENITVKKQIKLIEKENQIPLVITNAEKFTYDIDNPNFEITTSGGSGTGVLTYAIKEDVDGIASISGNTITYNKAGTFTITATKESDDTYKESIAEKTITIDKQKQNITITNTDFKLGSASNFKITIDGRATTLTKPLTYDLSLGKDEVASIQDDIITPIKAGIIEISVTSLGDDVYEDIIITKQIELLEKENQTPLVITNTDRFPYDSEQLSFEIATSGGSGSGAITYAIKEDVDHVASISGNLITYSKAGTFTIIATKASDDTYKESIAEKVITIDKLSQAITITNENFVLETASDFKIDVDGRVATLTQPLQYDLTLGKDDVASIQDDTITPIKVGTIEISVTSIGDHIYKDQTITKQIQIVEKENQTPLIITNADKRTYDKDHLSFDITTSGGSGTGEMTYEIIEDLDGIASLSGSTITYTKPGRFTIVAKKASDNAYKESQAEKTITIEKLKQTDFIITNTDFIITSAPNFKITVKDRPSELNEPLQYDIKVGKDSVATIVDDIITPITTGDLRISVTSIGNDIYEDITIEKTIKITRLPSQNPEISITNKETVVYGENENSLQITTTGGQGNGEVTYKVSPENIATIDSHTGLVTIKEAGSFDVTVTKSGGGIYADSVASKHIIVEQAEQTAFAITNTDFTFQSSPDFEITTTGRVAELTQPLIYDVISGKGDIVTLSKNRITPLKTGSITISVKSIGNKNYKDKIVEKMIEITSLPEQNVALNITNEDVVWGDNKNIIQTKTTGGQGSGAITYSLQEGDEAIASIHETTGVITIKKVGMIHILAKKSGNGIYQDAHASKTIQIKQKEIVLTPKKVTKKVNQVWASVVTNGYDIEPSLVGGDQLQGTPIYAYSKDVNDNSPAGTYHFTLDGLSNPNYKITYREGVLVVEEAMLNPDDLFAYYRIKSGVKGLNNWYISDVVFESLKKDGYDYISNTTAFTGSEFTVTKEGKFNSDIYFKNINGTITKAIQVPLKIDKTAPIMDKITLREKNTNAFAKFINTLSFGNWLNQEIEVELSGHDELSEVHFEYQEEIDGVLGEWKKSTGKLSYGNGANVILHVKAIDEAGNKSIDTMTSERIQIDLEIPVIDGVEAGKKYYLPKVVAISDTNSGLNMDASYFINASKKALHKNTLFNGIGDITLHVEDNAGNINTLTFSILGLPPIDSIVNDDTSREIVKDVQDEYDKIKDKLTDEKQKQEIEDWLEKAKEKSKKYVDVVIEPDSGILIDGNGDVLFEEDIVLVVEVITTKIQNEKIDLEKVEGLDKDDEIKVAYDIFLQKGNEKIQPEGMIQVKIPNTKEIQQIEDLKLVYIDDKNAVTLYPSTINKDYIVFTTDHFSNYAIIGKRDKLNIDVDKDGIPDLNIDTDHDGLPDVNLDIDDDGEADLNVDTNRDLIPDINIDTTGDGKANVNIDVDGNGVADINISKRITSWNPKKDFKVNGFAYDSDVSIIASINIDLDGDGKADINIDTDGDGEADTNVDTDMDGVPDSNLDEYWKNKLSKGENTTIPSQSGGVFSGDENRWSTWWMTLIVAAMTMITTQVLKRKFKAVSRQK